MTWLKAIKRLERWRLEAATFDSKYASPSAASLAAAQAFAELFSVIGADAPESLVSAEKGISFRWPIPSGALSESADMIMLDFYVNGSWSAGQFVDGVWRPFGKLGT